ncbi:hypothetical protein DV454_000074 [Geotrichum candidum]|nr:hypothetical protein DV454_000074 [Geotrichum candidum]
MASSSIATPGTPPPPTTTATSTTTATAVMAQEMSAVQTLKRLSIGASLTLDPDLPNYNDFTATSPTSEQAFDFSSTSNLDAASQQLLWVPAHVHPEIAPQQWKNFVQDKLAEIKASGHSTSLSPSSPIKRRNSSLSRQIKDQEHYTDGAEVLEKRKSIDNLQQQNHDPTILSLSQKLESLGELEGWSPSQHLEEKAELRPVAEHRAVVDKVERKPTEKSDREPGTDTIERKPVGDTTEERGISATSVERKPVLEPTGEQIPANEPVERQPVSEPIGPKPIEESVIEKKSIERKPVEPKPVELKPVEPKPVELKPVELKPVELKPVELKPVESKPVESLVQTVTSNDHDVEHKVSNVLNHTAHQEKKHGDTVGRKQIAEHVERKPVSKSPERKPVHEAGKPAREPIERKQVKEPIESIPIVNLQQNTSAQPEVVDHQQHAADSIHSDPVEPEPKEVFGHSRSKNRKGTWGWLFNGVTSPPTGRTSPESNAKLSTSSLLPEQSDSVIADKASIDKFLNRTPSPNPDNSLLPTTMAQGRLSPEKAVITPEETAELVENNHNDYSDGSTSRKISGSASIAETKDRISNFFSKKKSIANIKQQRQQERAKNRTSSPRGSHTRSSVVKHHGHYRSRSRHRSASPNPVTEPSPEPSPEPVSEPVSEPEPEMRAIDQVDFMSEAIMSGIIPEGMEPITNAAGLVSYSAEAAAFYGAPYQIPAYQYSDKSLYMMNHRYEPHIERAIYRLSHLKLGNARRPLVQQVLLSNFMYAYLNLINQGFIRQQQEAQIEMQRQQQQLQMQHQYQQQMQHHQQEHPEQYDDDPDDLTGGSQKPSYNHMYEYATTNTADSSSSSSASSVAGDDLWQEDTFYDSQEVC